MTEYIDRDAFIAHIRKDPLFGMVAQYGITGVIKAFPASDVQPVKHGRWLLNSDRIPVCSVCDGIALQKILLRFPTPEYYSKFVLSNYCPHCGAIIDGGDF